MNCCGKQRKLKINERCVKHPHQNYFYFCTNQHCLEILCRECIKGHQDAHFKANKGEPEICWLNEVEAFFEQKAKSQIQYQNQKAKPQFIKDIDPCQILCHTIDQYFYGTSDNKSYNEQARAQAMNQLTAIKLVGMIQKEGEYRLSHEFKAKYFEFLDALFKETEH